MSNPAPRGGRAAPNHDSVVDAGDRIVETAVKIFGRVDIVINNAGILRDKSFANMGDEDWDLVQKVHLKGAFKVRWIRIVHYTVWERAGEGEVLLDSKQDGMGGRVCMCAIM